MNTTPAIIKQFGIWRSCTNYLRRVLLLNWNQEQLSLVPARVMEHTHNGATQETARAWLEKQHKQHFELLMQFDAIRFVVTVRHPYSWVPGYFRYMYHKSRRPKCKYDRSCPADYGRAIQELLNPRYSAWRELVEQDTSKAMYLQHEDLVANFPGPLVELAVRLDLRLNGSQLKNISRIALSSGKLHPKKNFDPTYYTERRYLSELTPAMLQSIKENTDWETAAYFGYYPDD